LMEIPSLPVSKQEFMRCRSVFMVIVRHIKPCFDDLSRA
jgi:hypothetical protein